MATTSTASLLSIPKPSFKTLKISHYTPLLRLNSHSYPSLRLQCSAVQVEAVISPPEQDNAAAEETNKRKLYVSNLPWALGEEEIKKLFGEFGEVKGIDIIRHQNGKSRGFAFITMGTPEAALAAKEKLNLSDQLGRTLKVEYSKTFNKPIRRKPETAPENNPNYTPKAYVSNLAFKVRSVHLKEFFSGFNPVSARVVFEGGNGRSTGYGFVGFGSKEEAEKAIAELDGKQLMERTIRVRMSQKVDKTLENSSEETQDVTKTPENSSEEMTDGAKTLENSSQETHES